VFLVDLEEEVVEQLVLQHRGEQEILHQHHHHKEIQVDLLQEMMRGPLVVVVHQQLAERETLHLAVPEVRELHHQSLV
jgi:hypothetical protein